MQAIRVHHTGGPEVMELQEVPVPQAKSRAVVPVVSHQCDLIIGCSHNPMNQFVSHLISFPPNYDSASPSSLVLDPRKGVEKASESVLVSSQ